MDNESHTTTPLSNEWLQALVSELDNENVVGIAEMLFPFVSCFPVTSPIIKF